MADSFLRRARIDGARDRLPRAVLRRGRRRRHLLRITGTSSSDISDKAHGLIGVALGLLLVFRTNASYDRFWEGRKQWGGIVNETRNLARGANRARRRTTRCSSGASCGWTIAFTWASMFHLRGQKNLGPGRGPAPARRTPSASSTPSTPAPRGMREISVSHRRRAAPRGSSARCSRWRSSRTCSCSSTTSAPASASARRRCPSPTSCTCAARCCSIASACPSRSCPTFGYGTIPATGIVAYILLGIEEIGVEIEDPFGTDDNDLPVDDICRTIDTNLRSLLPTGQTFAD
jgi:putative membrane protein